MQEAREIHRNFEMTEYGADLKGQPRWDRYRPDHISVSDWIELIGQDADNLDHLLIMYKIARVFINRDDGSLRISPTEAKLLEKAAIIHDWGESKVSGIEGGGDINIELKTVLDEDLEQARFLKIYSELCEEDVKDKHLMLSIIWNTPESNLGRIFAVIEKIGYLRTAIKAYQLSKTTEDPVLKSHLEWLTAGVLSNQTTPLVEASADYTPVKKYLGIVSGIIDDAFASLDSDIFYLHGQDLDKKEEYIAAKVAWQKRAKTPRSQNNYTRSNETIFGEGPNYKARFIEDESELKTKIEAIKSLGLKTVLTSGSFDLLHIGHMKYLEKASTFGDILIVGVDSDEKIRRRKGLDRPVVSEEERIMMLAHVRNVDLITLKQPDDEKWNLIKLVRPDVLIATAETYNPQEIEELESKYCGKVVVLEPQATTSTSARIRRLSIGHFGSILETVIESVKRGDDKDRIKELAENAIRNA